MNKLIIALALCFLTAVSFSQPAYPYKDIKLEKPSDYKETEPLVLSAANFLLSTKYDDANEGRKGAISFLTEWMTGAKDYGFYLKGLVTDISSDRELLNLCIAAMLKYTLENKATAVNPLAVDANVSKILLAYCDNPENNFKLKKRNRKILESKL
jgi:hypothetical protein